MTDEQTAVFATFCEEASSYEIILGLSAIVAQGMPYDDQRKFWSAYGMQIKQTITDMEGALESLREIVEQLEPAN